MVGSSKLLAALLEFRRRSFLKMPKYDRFTYRRHGQLLVQHYVEPGVLRAWCLCGAWFLVSAEDLHRGKVDSCRVCSSVRG